MALRELFKKTRNSISQRISKMKRPVENLHPAEGTAKPKAEKTDSVLVAAEATRMRQERSIEKLEQIELRFTELVSHLDGINNNLKDFPGFVENQKQLTQHFVEYIQSASENDRKLIGAIEKLGESTEKQNRRFVYIVAGIVGGGIIIAMILLLINYLW